MKNLSLLVFLLISILCIQCQVDTDSHQSFLNPQNIESQFFEITPGKDTTIRAAGGSLISFKANTFLSTNTIRLEIKEILSKSDIVKSGLSTVDSEGNILESGGMIYLNTDTKQQINPNFPIEVQLPSDNGLNTKMKIFRLRDPVDPSSGWILQSDLTNIQLFGQIERGETLYNQHCSMCHSKNLRKDLTGPALGNVTLFRDKNWLAQFTRNSQKMIAARDSLALSVWHQWRPVLMSNFDSLSNQNIEDIYTFITNESLVQEIGINEINFPSDYIKDPDTTPDQDNYVVLFTQDEGSIDTLREDFAIYLTRDGNGNIISSDTIFYSDSISNTINYFNRPPEKARQTFNNYQFNVFEFGWYNVDYFLSEDIATTTVAPFKISIENEKQNKETTVILIFKNRKVVIQTELMNKTYIPLFSDGKEDVQMPIGEEVWVVALSNIDGIDWFSRKLVKIGQQNTHSLELKETAKSDIDAFLEEL